MHEPIDIETVSAEALRKIGRNIVNFSKIEGGLKLLLSLSNISGPIKTVSNQVLDNKERLHKQTLGALVTEFRKTILSNVSHAQPPSLISEPWVSISFKVSSPDVSRKELECRLKALVKERNQLIHHQLAPLDMTSPEVCHQLINFLDEQNPRLLAHLDELKWMLDTFREGLDTIRQSPKSWEVVHSPTESA